MKPTDPLDDLLSQWPVPQADDPSFHREVWHRIAAGQDESPWAERFLNWWFRPRRIALSAAACVLLGFIAGGIAGAKNRTQARDVYLSSINPLDSHHPHYAAR